MFILLTPYFFVKVDLLKNKFGFDEAFNYKEEQDLDAALKGSVFVQEIQETDVQNKMPRGLMLFCIERKVHHLSCAYIISVP